LGSHRLRNPVCGGLAVGSFACMEHPDDRHPDECCRAVPEVTGKVSPFFLGRLLDLWIDKSPIRKGGGARPLSRMPAALPYRFSRFPSPAALLCRRDRAAVAVPRPASLMSPPAPHCLSRSDAAAVGNSDKSKPDPSRPTQPRRQNRSADASDYLPGNRACACFPASASSPPWSTEFELIESEPYHLPLPPGGGGQ
jgi:hypothetical protein